MASPAYVPARLLSSSSDPAGMTPTQLGIADQQQPPAVTGGTVIIDEASMITEEQLDAVLDNVSQIERLILVGDPRQLPPIGAGRPFVDIVEFLKGRTSTRNSRRSARPTPS